jgi:hypothetical protein
VHSDGNAAEARRRIIAHEIMHNATQREAQHRQRGSSSRSGGTVIALAWALATTSKKPIRSTIWHNSAKSYYITMPYVEFNQGHSTFFDVNYDVRSKFHAHFGLL